MPVFIPTNGVEAVVVNFTILKGDGLAAKDRSMFGSKTTSDPYVVVTLETTMPAAGRTRAQKIVEELGKTKTIMKTLAPEWKESFSATLPCSVLQDPKAPPKIILSILDYDQSGEHDSMGVVTIPMACNPPQNKTTKEWYPVPASSAKNAKGKLQVQITTEIRRATTLQRGNSFPLETNRLRIGLSWDLVKGKIIDLDAACVAIDNQGIISMDNSVYYGNLANSNESIRHSGDSRDGNKEGEDESVFLELDRIPGRIIALYLILTVASSKKFLNAVASARVTLVDNTQKNSPPMGTFVPSEHVDSQDTTALFLVRIARNGKAWIVQPIEDTHQSARNFGSLIPHIKSYSKDLIPGIKIDPKETVCVMRKGGAIKIKDFCPGHIVPDKVAFGLSWDMTHKEGQADTKVDLDASAICLDADLKCVDKVWFKHLQSEDGAIGHAGDQRSGDGSGDDERIMVTLPKIAARIHYIGFTVNSYSGQELNDVQKAACHLFDTVSGTDIAMHGISDCSFLVNHTALLMGVLYRVKGRSKKESEWCLKVIGQAANGKTVKDLVDVLTKFLQDNPVHAPISDVKDDETGVINIKAEMPPAVPIVQG